MKMCCKCQQTKSLDLFHNNKNMPDGKHHYCKPCEKQRRQKIYANNAEQHKARSNQWKRNNSTRVKQTKKIWEANNRGRVNALWMKRYTNKLKATPAWAELDRIQVVYQKAKQWNMQVDHVIPLQGKNVCGLHVWANLQLLDPSFNLSKGNKYYD